MGATPQAPETRWSDLLSLLREAAPQEAETLAPLAFGGFQPSCAISGIALLRPHHGAPLAIAASELLRTAHPQRAVAALGRIARSLACLQPALDEVLAQQPGAARLVLGFDDDGGDIGLCFDRQAGSGRLLLPDLYLLRHLRTRAPVVELPAEGFATTHAVRRPVLFWRGASTGPRIRSIADLESNPRIRACLLARAVLGGLADMRIVQLVVPPDLAEAAEAWAHERDLLGPRVPAASFASHRMTLDLPGNAASWGVYARYLEGTLVLRVESSRELIYSDRLLPWVHYVPVAADLHDLAERVRWALAEPEAASAIAHAGHAAMVAILGDVPDLTRAALRQAIAQDTQS